MEEALFEPTLGQRMRKLREARELSRPDVVRAAEGVTLKNLSEIENDKISRSKALRPICKLYGIPMAAVLRPSEYAKSHGSRGEIIEATRVAVGYDRRELAEAVGLTYHQLYGIERSNKSSDRIPEIEQKLGIAPTRYSHLLNEIRASLMLDSQRLAVLAGTQPEKLEQAEDGDEKLARKIIVDLVQALSHHLPDDTAPRSIIEASPEGILPAPADGDAPETVKMGDATYLVDLHDDAHPGDMSLLIRRSEDVYEAFVGRYSPKHEDHFITLSNGHLVPFDPYDAVHFSPLTAL